MRVQNVHPAGVLSFLILTALQGCDNVGWGGADVQIVPAPPPPGEALAVQDSQSYANMGLPSGTVLLHVVRGPGGTVVVPVAEVSGDSLRTLRRPEKVSAQDYQSRFRQAVLEPGAQIELFRRGASVGTLNITGPGPVTACGIPTAVGNATTVAAAADVGEFLGFRRGLAPEVRGEYTPPQIDGTIRTYSSIVAERLILQNGLPRPRSWAGAQRDLQAIEVIRGGNPEMAATYLVGDNLAQGPAQEGGYSVFYLAGYEQQSGYSPVYSEVRNYARTGKAAPRLIDYLNWDRVGGQNVLIQVYGRDRTWYEMVSQEAGGRWRKNWEGGKC
ncbi:MAG: hypothetical protein M3P24_09725 [Gemmatimonadota bacterium]|nr:hypothetical protein [Gemmatimonadota bacterium]